MEKKSILIGFSTNYIIHYNGFQINYNALCFAGRKETEFFFSPVLLSARNIGNRLY